MASSPKSLSIQDTHTQESQAPSYQVFSVSELMQGGVHYGHLTRFRYPAMQKYIYGIRQKLNIIDLDKTVGLLSSAQEFVFNTVKRGGKILFVGTKRAVRELMSEYANKLNMPHVSHRWLGGMLTNFKTIKQSIRRLRDLEKLRDSGEIENLTKKEALTRVRELEKLERSLGGIKNMNSLPEAIFIIDVGQEKIAIKEANKLKIPVIGVVDTNSSPDGLDYVIPGNDDARKAIKLYLDAIGAAIEAGKIYQRSGGSNTSNVVAEKPEVIEITEDGIAEQAVALDSSENLIKK